MSKLDKLKVAFNDTLLWTEPMGKEVEIGGPHWLEGRLCLDKDQVKALAIYFELIGEEDE